MFENPTTDRLLRIKTAPFAHFSAVGTWSPSEGCCPECTGSSQVRIEPMLVEWEPSTDIVGDFSWDGPFGYEFIVKEHVADCFRDHSFQCNFLRVEHVAPATNLSTVENHGIPSQILKNLPPDVANIVATDRGVLGAAKMTTPRRRVRRVEFPYTGPTLLWPDCYAVVDLDYKASHVEVERVCSTCERTHYTFRNSGIVIRRKEWSGEKMFRIRTNGKSAATFVTDEGRAEIEAARISNVAFTYAGEIVE